MDISELALRAQVAWFRGLAAAGFPQISVGEGFAVSTGLDSNTENGAVITPSVLDNAHDLDALLVWLRAKAVPASVVVTRPLTSEATAGLIDRGLEPERTGNNMGRLLDGFDPDTAEPSAPGWQISEVSDGQALRQNQRVYADDGWWDETVELDRRVEYAARLGFGPGRPVRHWTACHQNVPIGAATSFQFHDAVLLVHCCVAERWRRHGIGTALTRVRLAAAGPGTAQAVLFPSPDGYHLHHFLGFDVAPVHPNRWFYLR
ncbi:GNAT family N-acetyltransferase [Actinoplanes sp. NPDC020271]|uniref:GNAT family N-acetyltransferase n=1 Tax=Actinoplanes sp. NPDC020271 TaxID=3363896 RepID=UPI00379F58E6